MSGRPRVAVTQLMDTDTASRPSGRRAPWVAVTGLDGSGKSALVEALAEAYVAFQFRLPHHEFVRPALARSGGGAPFGDVLTDRLVFAADARLTNYLIREWRARHLFLVSQRGWMDNYVFGAIQGLSYEATDALLRTAELERPSAIIHLVADPDVAFERIRRDPDGDKYETRAFMRVQHRETLRFWDAVRTGLPILAPFAGIPACLLDTTALDAAAVVRAATGFLAASALVPSPAPVRCAASAPSLG